MEKHAGDRNQEVKLVHILGVVGSGGQYDPSGKCSFLFHFHYHGILLKVHYYSIIILLQLCLLTYRIIDQGHENLLCLQQKKKRLCPEEHYLCNVNKQKESHNTKDRRRDKKSVQENEKY